MKAAPSWGILQNKREGLNASGSARTPRPRSSAPCRPAAPRRNRRWRRGSGRSGPGPSAPANVPIAVESPSTSAERGRRELALHDQRGQRDDVADREAVGRAADQQQRRCRASASWQNSAAAWLNIEPDEIQRGSSRSTTMPSVSRPVTANTVITETESAACARPDQRLHERDLVHDEGDLRDRAPARTGPTRSRTAGCAARRAASTTARRMASAPARGLRPAPTAMTTGTRMTTITAAAISIAVGEAGRRRSARTSSGATTMPPKLAPLSASEIASPRLRANHWLISVGMVTRPSPSQPNDIAEVRRVDLPGLARESRAARARPPSAATPNSTKRRAPKRASAFAGEDHQHGVEQIGRGAGARDQRGRPAVQPRQFGEIDAVAVEPEAPARERHQEARDNHAPAEVARLRIRRRVGKQTWAPCDVTWMRAGANASSHTEACRAA